MWKIETNFKIKRWFWICSTSFHCLRRKGRTEKWKVSKFHFAIAWFLINFISVVNCQASIGSLHPSIFKDLKWKANSTHFPLGYKYYSASLFRWSRSRARSRRHEIDWSPRLPFRVTTPTLATTPDHDHQRHRNHFESASLYLRNTNGNLSRISQQMHFNKYTLTD